MAKDKKNQIDKEDFLQGFQQVFDTTNSSESTESDSKSKNEEIEEFDDNPNVKTVSPEFFENENNDENEKQSKKKPQGESEEDETSEGEEGEEEYEEEGSSEGSEEEETDPKGRDEKDDGSVDEHDDQEENVDESEIVDSFFDLFAQELGWDYDDNDKPKNISELVGFMDNLVQSASRPQFANEDIEKLNTFVENGGNLEDFLNEKISTSSVANLNIKDNEENQKRVIREQLKEAGIPEEKIEARIERYEDTGILEDEAAEAQELLKKYDKEKEEKLLEEQKKRREEAVKQQQKFVNDVKSTIDEFDNIDGVPLSKQQKEDLKRYIFEPGKDGQSQYQKDYSQSYQSLIKAAFYLKEGKNVVNRLQKKAGSDATKNLKKKLSKQNTKRIKNQSTSSGESPQTMDFIKKISKTLSDN